MIRLSELGHKELRLQPADHDSSDYHAYIVSTGRNTGGYGRTTRTASSGWEYSRKVTIERDDFTCQSCGAVGGPQGDVQLHVDHITPQSDGGSDDPDNLRTLCHDCHMGKHDSSGPDTKATNDKIARSIIQLAQSAEVPAFKKTRLIYLLNDSLTDKVRFRDVSTVLDTLLRYDRVEKVTLRNKVADSSLSERSTKEYSVYYLMTNGFDPSRLSYSGSLQYDGSAIEYNNVINLNEKQTTFGDFAANSDSLDP